MYLQITTRCNMACAHCCMSCRPGRGEHMSIDTFRQAVNFAAGYSECISIGGGEPTIHPEFFPILKRCLHDFDSVWMATNGKNQAAMRRLLDILADEDFPEDTEDEFAWDQQYIFAEGKLSVALSQDPFHEPIASWVVDAWRRNGYEIRNTYLAREGLIAQGRAVRTGVGQDRKNCVCPDLIIQPSGNIKMCGCTRAPIIGNVWTGIEYIWERRMRLVEKFVDTQCSSRIKWPNEHQLDLLEEEQDWRKING